MNFVVPFSEHVYMYAYRFIYFVYKMSDYYIILHINILCHFTYNVKTHDSIPIFTCHSLCCCDTFYFHML